MAFRKRKKRSANPLPKRVHHDTDDRNNTTDNDKQSARIISSDTIQEIKQRRKKRRIRMKATQRSFQSSRNTTNTNDQNTDPTPCKMQSNIGIYTTDYLNTLKQENKRMAVPMHIKQAIKDENERMNDIEMIESIHNDDEDDDDNDDDDEIMKAKILTSKLKRRTKALIHTVEESQHTTAHNTSNDMDPMHDFIALAPIKKTKKDEIKRRIQEEYENVIILTDSDDDLNAFEEEQMKKSGIKLKKKEKIKNREKDAPMSLEQLNEMIDDEMAQNAKTSNGKSYDEIKAEFHATQHNLEFNKKQTEAIDKKHSFFQRLKNESSAYLNCLSEKTEIINKYVSMDLGIREERHELWRKERCFNDLEWFDCAFYGEHFEKDMNTARAYQGLDDLDSNKKNNIWHLNIWNAEDGILNEREYLLQKKRRSECRYNCGRMGIEIENEFCVKRDRLLSEMNTQFEDTRSEYRSFNGMSQILKEWKLKYRKDYDSAFVSICVPKLIAPFVRMELIEWNALKHKINVDSEAQLVSEAQLFVLLEWYTLMDSYGTDDNGQIDADDADDIIVPTLVAALVIPQIINIIKFDWNPFEMRQTQQLSLQIKCALDHIDGYPQFDAKKEILSKALQERCVQIMDDFIAAKCIPLPLIEKILPHIKFKAIPTVPLELDAPHGPMYRYIKYRNDNALQLMECLSLVIQSMQYMLHIIENIYTSVIQGFVTYLARSPLRNAKHNMDLQIIIVQDLSQIVQRVSCIINKWKYAQQEEDDDDDDVQMHNEIKLPQSITKHLKRSIMEIGENINNQIKTNPNVSANLECLNNLFTSC